MNRKFIYPIILFIAIALIYWAEQSINTSDKEKNVQSNRQSGLVADISLLPTSTTGQIVYHNYYTLSYSEPDEQAEWVAYALTKAQLTGKSYERPYFEIDPDVSTGAADWRNYRGSGYDRGHLCPAGDRKFDKQAYLETFLTSNISPQRHPFNSGIWNRLEQKVRYWADKYDGVYIVTGGILKDKSLSIGEEEVTVPSHFYKILLDQRGEEYTMIAFLFPHEKSDKGLQEFVVSVDEVEELTGIDFFPKLEDSIENKLEASSDYKNWSFR
ncbi:DNA/RNA non-specific endonuclease [Flavimarina sp. Hel_I_48]|uniref:DNA/RNA non-specific endonuclease n=1 Tax=Flavimarina sp. Hel_I_48 TaxID=1392488 RepID=UPI0004DED00D|nr:DNA/RNA non-specific endonuclease [Flavimarina sp. Hel_I_48]